MSVSSILSGDKSTLLYNQISSLGLLTSNGQARTITDIFVSSVIPISSDIIRVRNTGLTLTLPTPTQIPSGRIYTFTCNDIAGGYTIQASAGIYIVGSEDYAVSGDYETVTVFWNSSANEWGILSDDLAGASVSTISEVLAAGSNAMGQPLSNLSTLSTTGDTTIGGSLIVNSTSYLYGNSSISINSPSLPTLVVSNAATGSYALYISAGSTALEQTLINNTSEAVLALSVSNSAGVAIQNTGGSIVRAIFNISENDTLPNAVDIVNITANGLTITLPPNPTSGQIITFVTGTIGGGITFTINANEAQNIDGEASYTVNVPNAYASVNMVFLNEGDSTSGLWLITASNRTG